MKRLGIISDTHLGESGRLNIPERVLQVFAGVEFIIHAGDFTSCRALEQLQTIAPVVGVRGNNDPDYLELPRTRRIDWQGVTIGVCHGDTASSRWARPLAAYPGNGSTAANALDCFEFEDDVRCIIFGHSHRAMQAWHPTDNGQILLLNPGSPTDKRMSPHYGCALLSVEERAPKAEMILW